MKAKELEGKLGQKSKKTVGDLAAAIRTRPDENPNYCLFLGAGASRTSGIRTAGEMIAEWRKLAFEEENPGKEDASKEEMQQWLSTHAKGWYDERREYATLFEKFYPVRPQRRKFVETEVAEKAPSIGYAYLVRIAEAGFLRTIFTTNFDDLLNEAFYQFSYKRPLVCAHDSSVADISITSSRSKIIKLHGDYLFDDLKNISSETKNLGKNMQDKLAEFLKEYGLIVVGYSGSDESVTDNFNELLKDQHYLQNGLYWCFRKDDEVNDRVFEILKNHNVFFVIVDGFDEICAELHSALLNDATPFNSKIASDRASKLIQSYIENEGLKNSHSKVIKKHLDELKNDRTSSLITDALTALRSESLGSSGISDSNLLVLLQIEQDLKDRRLDKVRETVSQELERCADKRFKEILLHRRFICSNRLFQLSEAVASVNQMLELEPGNYLVKLSKCSLLEDRKSRLDYLRVLQREHPYSPAIVNRLAFEMHQAIENRDKSAGQILPDDVLRVYETSITLDPSIANPAHSDRFDILTDKTLECANRKERIEESVTAFLKQNAHSAATASILVRYCKWAQKAEYDGRSLFDILSEGFMHHFPKAYEGHLEAIVDACVEFEQFGALRDALEKANGIDELKESEDYAVLLMRVYYDVFRNLGGAIKVGEKFLETKHSPVVESSLLKKFVAAGDTEKARKCLKRLDGAIGIVRHRELEADILEAAGRYQDAIDTINGIPDRREFEEKYTVPVGYNELMMGHYSKAAEWFKGFLEKRSFGSQFQVEIINYEFARLRSGKGLNKERLSRIADSNARPNAQAVAKLLLGDKKAALEILKKEACKEFSNIDTYLRWPVLNEVKAELQQLRKELLASQRRLEDLE